MSKPHLLVLTSTFPRWPDDHEPPFVFELCRRLTGRFEVTVLAPHAPGTRRHEEMDGVNVERFRYAPGRLEQLAYDGGIPAKLRSHRWLALLAPFFLLFEMLSTVRLLRRLRPQTLHAHWLLPQGIVALLALRLSGVKAQLVVTAHGADIHGLNSRFARWLKRRVICAADTVTVVSEALAEEVRVLGKPTHGIHVIPMGVDLTNTFTPSPKPTTGRTLVYAGRLVEKKGVGTLLQAMAMLTAHSPDYRLLIAGTGPLLQPLREQADNLGISDKVHFLDAYLNRDLPELLRQGDIAVFPFVRAAGGDQEGLGLVLVEAMGCGLPVIAGDLPAVHDVIQDQKTGLLVKPQDAGALCQSIERLSNNPELAGEIAQQGREYAIRHFDWQYIANRHNEIFTSHGPNFRD